MTVWNYRLWFHCIGKVEYSEGEEESKSGTVNGRKYFSIKFDIKGVESRFVQEINKIYEFPVYFHSKMRL